MKKTIFTALLLVSTLAYSQVGINTTDPKATLDVVANATESKMVDGIIAPRLTGNELKSKDTLYSTDQKGAIIYATAAASPTTAKTINVTTAGYYYFDGSVWKAFASSSTFTQTDDWHTTGNSGTTPGNNFLGTTDDKDLMLKRNNTQAGLIGTTNTSYGLNSLIENNTGTENAAFGVGALQSNTTGSRNTAFGFESLKTSTTINNNTAFGYRTLMNNIINTNVAFGYGALTNNTTGTINVAVGTDALSKNTTGYFNTATGHEALVNNTTGYENVAIGASSMTNNTTGYYNTALGVDALDANISGARNTALGWNAGKLATGNDNVFVGSNAGSNVTTGSNNIIIGYNAAASSATVSNQIRMGNTSITTARIQVAWSVTSDKRYKDDIQDSNLGLDFIRQLRPVSYIRKNDENHNREYGLIAQELQETLKNNGAVDSSIVTEDGNGMLSVRYNDLFAPLVKAVQEQQKEIDELQKRIGILEKK